MNEFFKKAAEATVVHILASRTARGVEYLIDNSETLLARAKQAVTEFREKLSDTETSTECSKTSKKEI